MDDRERSSHRMPPLPLGAADLLGRLRRRVRLFAGLTVLFGPGLGLATTLIGIPQAEIGWVFAGCFAIGGSAFTFAQWWQNGRVRRRLEAFSRGEFLIHWTYTEAEWQAFAGFAGLPDQPVGETYIGPQTAYCGGVFFEYSVLGSSLENIAWLDGKPDMLRFTIRNRSPQAGADFTRTYFVPVPDGMNRDDADRSLKGELNKRPA